MADNGEITARHFQSGEPIQLSWRDGLIESIQPAKNARDERWIAPGLFDIQMNGYGGVDFQNDEITPEQVLHAIKCLHRDGCTRTFYTLVTDEWPKMMRRLKRVREWRAKSPALQAAIAGWHIEGPFLSPVPGFHGAHRPELMLDPTAEYIRELRAITENDPVLLTVAPERAGAIPAIAFAASLGIKISLGHTNASLETLREAVKAGASAFTHLGNGCPQQLDRHDNILWRVLDTPGLTCGIIPDKVHVSPMVFRVLHRALEASSIYYTTDAVSAAGAPPGRYRVGHWEIDVGPDQIVRPPGKTHLAGSGLRPIQGVFRAAEMLDCSWRKTWYPAAVQPALLMGLPDPFEPGQAADFCIIDSPTADGPKHLQTFVHGKLAGE